MSETSARARRFARRLGSRVRKGLIGRRSPGAGDADPGDGDPDDDAVEGAEADIDAAADGGPEGGVTAGTDIAGMLNVGASAGTASCSSVVGSGSDGVEAAPGTGAPTGAHEVRGVGLSGGSAAPSW